MAGESLIPPGSHSYLPGVTSCSQRGVSTCTIYVGTLGIRDDWGRGGACQCSLRRLLIRQDQKREPGTCTLSAHVPEIPRYLHSLVFFHVGQLCRTHRMPHAHQQSSLCHLFLLMKLTHLMLKDEQKQSM